MAYPVSHEDSVPNAVPATILTEAERPEYVPVEANHQQVEVIDRAIAKLHRNLGHPGNKTLKSVLKYAGAADWIIDRAGAYKCDVCQATSMKNSTPVASAKNPAPLEVNLWMALNGRILTHDQGRDAL